MSYGGFSFVLLLEFWACLIDASFRFFHIVLVIRCYAFIHVAVSMLFLCNEIHKDPTLKAGCKRSCVLIWKIAIIAPNLIFGGKITIIAQIPIFS